MSFSRLLFQDIHACFVCGVFIRAPIPIFCFLSMYSSRSLFFPLIFLDFFFPRFGFRFGLGFGSGIGLWNYGISVSRMGLGWYISRLRSPTCWIGIKLCNRVRTSTPMNLQKRAYVQFYEQSSFSFFQSLTLESTLEIKAGIREMDSQHEGRMAKEADPTNGYIHLVRMAMISYDFLRVLDVGNGIWDMGYGLLYGKYGELINGFFTAIGFFVVSFVVSFVVPFSFCFVITLFSFF
ncbi:hypothetical protein DFH27DRAFT_316796 [Peziza echinospora]|nr:hypothetical protein DFH27DRAFT_316796 [Peziza echinospora]